MSSSNSNEKISDSLSDVLNEKIAEFKGEDSGPLWPIETGDFVYLMAELTTCTRTLSKCTENLTDALYYVHELTERELEGV